MRIALVAAVALLVLVFVAPLDARSGTPKALANCDTSTGSMDAAENQVLALVNEARTGAGLPALLASPGLARAAAWKSEDRSSSYGGGLSHTDSLGRSPSARGADCGYPGQVAENIAYGYPSPASVVDAWMGSPGHRANILNTYYVVAGVGYADGAWTLDFGIVNDSSAAPPPVATPTSPPPPPPPPSPPATPSPLPSPTPSPTPEPELIAGSAPPESSWLLA
jgi:hypothetical protein